MIFLTINFIPWEIIAFVFIFFFPVGNLVAIFRRRHDFDRVSYRMLITAWSAILSALIILFVLWMIYAKVVLVGP